MTKPLVLLFSGQGSQTFHMGRELVRSVPAVADRFHALDAVARGLLGFSIAEIVFDPARKRFEPFDRLLHSNPALFMLQFALADALIAEGVRPAAVMGASLGEIVALTVAGAFEPAEALELVIALAEVSERQGAAGGLIAVLAPPAIVDERPELFEGIEVAGTSAEAHFVAAGPADRLARLERVLGAEGQACLILPVRFAFHSSYMEPLRPALQAVFAGLEGRPLDLPVVSCVTAGTLERLPEGHLWQVVRDPMRLADAFRGLERRQGSLFVDLGPSGTMSTVAKYNLAEGAGSEATTVMSLFGNEVAAFEALRRRLGLGG
ncbi:bacillaene synthase trans-acting acyltransferase [Tistlia consotensis]|uniref:Bacillaene synthase trans-acting acyltransferase/trans-AT polyketide synthase, acyltransferase and oxidoreductase domain-containing protein n=1 Tax=Tistlia consotensis USBA 355 TaxID=560819 RepID=A0A1Y6BAK2_9PROT|nr:acyltransferase domain-containing protein [Tistlia consotensis]SMF00241.1 bacillaene synthase trans-acting acyltransferase/trans-AT polyketide synthase, acyltransferase and oxidoreductase domain-containing protein [Tistlia consotensis USBA 355]SNR76123.1 bacillaene synthase trans-acting acyltransferase [Tistlia consotensis]